MAEEENWAVVRRGVIQSYGDLEERARSRAAELNATRGTDEFRAEPYESAKAREGNGQNGARSRPPVVEVKPQIPEKLEVVNGWLVEVVDEHTCGAGPGSGGGHEPDCGLMPIASIEHVFELLTAEAASAQMEPTSFFNTDHEVLCTANLTPLGEPVVCDCSASRADHIDDCD